MRITIPIYTFSFIVSEPNLDREDRTYIVTAMGRITHALGVTLDSMEPATQAQTAYRAQKVDCERDFIGTSWRCG
jgi:hypothetical protein